MTHILISRRERERDSYWLERRRKVIFIKFILFDQQTTNRERGLKAHTTQHSESHALERKICEFYSDILLVNYLYVAYKLMSKGKRENGIDEWRNLNI